MKKLFFITSIILLVLGFTSCSKDEIKPDDAKQLGYPKYAVKEE